MDDELAQLTFVVLIAAAVVFSLYGWDLLVSLAGLLPWRGPPPSRETRRFAILVCAHNESKVISGVIESLRALRYPSEAVQIFVVADNCDDDTAAIAARAGAAVVERRDSEKRTKGYALQFGLANILAGTDVDAVCVFDADNRVDVDFLAVMNRYLGAGHVAIQGYLDTKNPYDSWVTRCIALAYLVTNRFFLRARARLGLPGVLGGTGVCVATPVLRSYQWDPGSVADDLDFTMELIFAGVPVSYAPEARTYDEKPRSLALSLRQRSRWLQGHHDVAFRWLGRMGGALLGRRPGGRTVGYFDACLHLLQPLRLLAAFGLLVAEIVLLAVSPELALHSRPLLLLSLGVFAAVFVVYPVLLALLEGASFRLLLVLPLFFLYSFTWIPASFLGLLRVRRRVWVHTPHG